MKSIIHGLGLFSLLLIVLFFPSCHKKIKADSSPLIGKWISSVDDDTYWEFQSDKFVKYIRNGKESPGNDEIMISTNHKTTGPHIFGPLYYEYRKLVDTIKFETYGSLNNKIWTCNAAMREGNILYVWNYKRLSGIENHIDEVNYFCLEGKSCPMKSQKKVTVIIESGLEGALHISFGQKDGIPYEFDINSSPVITVDQGSIHKTTLPWHPAYMTHDAFDFKVKDCNNESIIDINDWGHTYYRNKARAMYKTDSVSFRKEDYGLTAFSLGYNQYPRDILDYEFGEYLFGQVASFSIGYLKDQYRYKDFMIKIKSTGEDIKG